MSFWDARHPDAVPDGSGGDPGDVLGDDRGDDRAHEPDAAPRRPKPVKEHLGYSAAIVVVLVLAALVGSGWWYAHRQADGRIPHGTTVAGVDIGGERYTEAVATLRHGLASRVATPITVDISGTTSQVAPAAAGLTVDYRASIDRAVLSHSWDPTQLWDFFTGTEDLQPVVTVNRVKLRREVTVLAAKVGRPTHDAGVVFADGRVQVVHARAGAGLDLDKMSSALVKAFLDGTSVAKVTLTSVSPLIDDAFVQRTIDRVVNPAISSPVTLVFDGHAVRLRPGDYQDALTLTPGPNSNRLIFGVNKTRLMRLVLPATKLVDGPVDASIEILDGRPQVVPARRGTAFDPDTVARVFLATVSRHDERDRRAVVPSRVVEAPFTSQAARALQITEPVSTYTTHFTGAQESTAVLARQAALVDGTVVRPGGTFSLRRLLGGGSGDASQLATTLYNAAFFAGLRDVQHTPPLPHVARFPLGREATVRSGGPDLRFADDTPYGVLVQASVSPGTVAVTLWSVKVWDVTLATSCARSARSSAYEVVTSRIFRKPSNTRVDHIQKVYTTYPTLSDRECRAANVSG